MLTVDTFTSTQRDLLGLEQDEETEQNKSLFHGQSAKELEKQGVCLTKLHIESVTTGLYGRQVVKFTRDPLPNHSFSAGDIAGAAHKDLRIISEGIVSRVGKNSLSVAFEDLTESPLHQLSKICLLKLTNTVTYTRYLTCLKHIDKQENPLIEKLLKQELILPPSLPSNKEVTFHNTSLNSGQKRAVELCLERSDLAVIHGPPGTGKTTTIIEVIRQHISLGSRVLVCAPSNIAVDNLLIKLAAASVRVVRLGHPARVNTNLQHLCLDAKLKERDEDNILGDVRKDIDTALNRSGVKHRNHGNMRGIGELRKELRERELKLTREVLKSAEVVLCTLTSAGREGPLGKLGAADHHHFDVCVIDEASQALEVACWIGILNTKKKVILAGDHLQLPPTIKSDKAAKDGLSMTMMERILDTLKSDKADVCTTLTEQYRMNEAIMSWSSNEMYGGNLTAHSSVASHVLSELPEVESTDITSVPLCFIDTAGTSSYETLVGVSRGNEGEAQLVVEYLSELKNAGVPEISMSVITPYNLQIELIRAEMGGRFRDVEVCTVDGFQGREKEAIVISMVRSNEAGEIGFLSETRRMNVAVTRARRHVCLIGDSLTVKRDAFLGRLVEYFTSHGIVKSAFEFGMDIPGTEDRVAIATPETPSDVVTPETKPSENTTSSDTPSFKETWSVRLNDYKESAEKEPLLFEGLTPYQRKIIHSLCEEMSLFSASSGTGSSRTLSVSKSPLVSNCEVKTAVDELDVEDARNGDTIQDAKADTTPIDPEDTSSDTQLSSLSVCKQCGKRIPHHNLELHTLRCEPKNFSKSKAKANNKKVQTAPSKKNQPPKNPTPSSNLPDDDDAVLARAAAQRLTCPVERCSGDVRTYMSPCRFCCRCLCSDHQLPEAHGCGDAARKDAKSTKHGFSARQQEQNKNRLRQALKEKGKERTKKTK